MSKSVFILFFFFFSLYSFSQEVISTPQKTDIQLSCKKSILEKEKNSATKNYNTLPKQIVLTYRDTFCEVITIKISDLLNEQMLKKLRANA